MLATVVGATAIVLATGALSLCAWGLFKFSDYLERRFDRLFWMEFWETVRTWAWVLGISCVLLCISYMLGMAMLNPLNHFLDHAAQGSR